MKNMKVSKKLIIGFLSVVILATIVGAVGIFGMVNITQSKNEMFVKQTVPIPYLAKSIETIQEVRVYIREMAISAMNRDAAGIDDKFASISALIPEMDSAMDAYHATIVNPEVLSLFEAARSLFDNELSDNITAIHAAARRFDTDALTELMVLCSRYSGLIINDLERVMELKIKDAQLADESSDALANLLLTIIIVIVIACVAASIIMTIYISGIISKPLTMISRSLTQLGTKGNLDFDERTVRETNLCADRKDEIGLCAKGFKGLVSHLETIEKSIIEISQGDLTTKVKTLSDKDNIGRSLERTLENLNTMFSEINTASVQVSTGAKQIADGSQSLAQGSTEQAASVEELSSSMADIAIKTKDNAVMAERAASLADTIKCSAEKGSRQMDEMMSAVRDINTASQSISRVIKVIDDIAFQTNILALNAAVEAARAGQHGKGFAVVAEEVRNLAAKSAEAAKDTGGLIANSIEKAELGARIADDTAASLVEIVSGINESNQLVNEIAKSSEMQSYGIEQINQGIEQVTQVVQQNSATAQQSAAASEQMSGQSAMLEQLISQFKLSGTRQGFSSLHSKKTDTQSSYDSGGGFAQGGQGSFGKY